MKAKGVSISKFEDGVLNEDAVRANPNFIAVSDGAGGGGVFAERWSHYLIYNLPNVPITTFEELDSWIDGIWEQFYNECETWAQKQQDGLFLKKFYDEAIHFHTYQILQSRHFSSTVRIHWHQRALQLVLSPLIKIASTLLQVILCLTTS